MKIKFSNIENLLQLFQGSEDISIENLSSVEPIGIALLKLHDVAYPDSNITIEGSAIYYVLELLSGDVKNVRTSTPLVQFSQNTTNIEEIVSDVTAKIINNTTNLSIDERRDLSRYLEYLISEMMDNVTSHSCSLAGGFITAQYYSSRKKTQVVIVDNGVGLLKSLSSHYPLATEEEAILKAMEKAVTGSNAYLPYTHVPKHAGLGLFFLSKILEYTDGRYIIISNDTVYRSSDKSFKVVDTSFKGTMIAFEIYEEGLDYEFNQLFGIIRDEDKDQLDLEEDVF